MFKPCTQPNNKKEFNDLLVERLVGLRFSKDAYKEKKDIDDWFINGGYRELRFAIDLEDQDKWREDTYYIYYQHQTVYKDPLEEYVRQCADIYIERVYHIITCDDNHVKKDRDCILL